MLMDLFIETLTGVSFELRVSPAETVVSVKSKIQRAEGIPISQQHLIWQDGELDDHRRLRDYSICGGSTIRLVLSLRGGPLNAHRVPPLRLAPLHLSSSMPSHSKLNRHSAGNKNIEYLPGCTLPSLTSGFLAKGSSMTLPDSCMVNRPVEMNKVTDAGVSTDRTASDLKCHTSAAMTIASKEEVCHDDTQTTTDFPGRKCTSQDPLGSVADASPTAGEARKSCCPNGDRPEFVDRNPCCSVSLKKSEVLNESRISLTSSGATASQYVGGSSPLLEQSIPHLYPPLFAPGTTHSTKCSYDWSSYWRLYESHSIATSFPKAFLIRGTYPLISATEVDSDTTPPGTASGRESRPFNEPEQPVSRKSPDMAAGNFAIPGTGTATTLLAGILSTTGDQLEFPYQASGTEPVFDQPHYPYHWLRKSLLPGDDDLSQRLATSTIQWNRDDGDDDASETHPFDLDAARAEDDGDDGASTVLKGSYDNDVDDNDSLADLEDYLLYYRTGDLLFGPPVTTIHPYSQYSARDTYSSDLEADFGMYTTRTSKAASDEFQDGSTWYQECNRLAEKVNTLKNRMKELRLRRQCRHKKQTDDKVTTAGESVSVVNTVVSEQACPASLNTAHSESCFGGRDESASFPVTYDPTTHEDIRSSPLHRTPPTHTPVHKTDLMKPRQRRFGSVTPPELNLLSAGIQRRNNSISFTPSASEVNEGSHHPPSLPSFWTSISSKPGPQRPLSSLFPPLPSNFLVNLTKGDETFGTSLHIPIPYTTDSVCSVDLRPLVYDNPRPPTENLRIDWSSQTSVVLNCPTSTVSHEPTVSSTVKPLLSTSTKSRVSAVGDGVSPESKPVSLRFPSLPFSPSTKTNFVTLPRSPPKPAGSPNNSVRRKRCSLCLRKIGIVNSYSCRCGRNFCSRHRYAETHACQFDYKADARRTLIESNPVVTAPKLPKI